MEIRLTESELTRLISRIIRETEEEGLDSNLDIRSDMGHDDFDMEEDSVEVIAQFFEDEGINDLSPRQINRIESKVERILDSESMGGDLYEEEEMNKRPSFTSRLMKRGGEGMAVTGFMGFIGNVMGWSEFETTKKLHDLTSQLQLDNYTGPITVAMIASGIALALAGRARQHRDMGR